jgi:hypothetical protein
MMSHNGTLKYHLYQYYYDLCNAEGYLWTRLTDQITLVKNKEQIKLGIACCHLLVNLMFPSSF